MKKFSLKTKLIMVSLFLSLANILNSVVSNLYLHKVEQSYDQIVDGSLPNLNLLNNMFLTYRSIRINVRTLGLPNLPDDQAKEAITHTEEAIANYEKFNKEYISIPFVEGEKELYENLNKSWLKFKAIGIEAVEHYKKGTPQDLKRLQQIFFEDCPQAAKQYTLDINKIKEFHVENSKHFVADAKKTGSQANFINISVSVIGVIAGLIFSFLFATNISKTMTNITDDLTQTSNDLASASVQLSSSSQQLSQATTEQAASLEQTASALEEISSMIAKASESAKSSATTSNESHEKAEEGKNAVEKMLVSMDEISQSNEAIMNQINSSNQQMSEIVHVIQEIGNKTKVINEIVFQTKLLSFNASVEAARAGEHGKGFAVVAEEVGNLAQTSGNAAKEIGDMLASSTSKVETIVSETKTRVESLISQGKQKVESGIDVAKQCANILSEIVDNVSRVANLAQEISQANQEQAQGVQEINKAVAQLDTVTQQNASTSEESASASEKLSQQAKDLQSSVQILVMTIQGDNSVQENETHASVKKETPMGKNKKSVSDSSSTSTNLTTKVTTKKSEFTFKKAYKKEPVNEESSNETVDIDVPSYNDVGFKAS